MSKSSQAPAPSRPPPAAAAAPPETRGARRLRRLGELAHAVAFKRRLSDRDRRLAGELLAEVLSAIEARAARRRPPASQLAFWGAFPRALAPGRWERFEATTRSRALA